MGAIHVRHEQNVSWEENRTTGSGGTGCSGSMKMQFTGQTCMHAGRSWNGQQCEQSDRSIVTRSVTGSNATASHGQARMQAMHPMQSCVTRSVMAPAPLRSRLGAAS